AWRRQRHWSLSPKQSPVSACRSRRDTTMISVPLVAILLLGAPVLFLLPKAWRSPAHVLFPAVVLVLLATGRVAPEIQANYVGYSLVLQRLDSLALPFVVVFALVLLIGGLYGFHFKDTAEKAA